MLEITRIQAITLDLDDTLWPVWPTIARAEERLQQWLLPRAPVTASVFSESRTRLVLREQVCAQWPNHQHDLGFVRREMIRLGLRHSGEDAALAEEAFAVFLAARQEVVLYEDAAPGLQRLAARWPVLALSNGNADVHRIGIGHYFCAAINAGDAGAAKPDPRIFHAAAHRLAVAPEAILHVGDDAEMDVLGAQGVGMQTAWINRAGKTWSHGMLPHAHATTMTELCVLLGV